MARKKSKQPLAGRDVPSSSVYGGIGTEPDNSERGNSGTSATAQQASDEIQGGQATTRIVKPKTEERRLDTRDAEAVEPRKFTPPNCSMCTALRPSPESNYVRVFTTRHETNYTVRYCKCHFCGNSFKSISKRVLSP